MRVGQEIPDLAEGERKQKVAAMTQELGRFFEASIRRHPADWHMLQRVFVADLDPARLARSEAAVAAADAAQDADGSQAVDGTGAAGGSEVAGRGGGGGRAGGGGAGGGGAASRYPR